MEKEIRGLLKDPLWGTFIVGTAAGLLAWALVRHYDVKLPAVGETIDDARDYVRRKSHDWKEDLGDAEDYLQRKAKVLRKGLAAVAETLRELREHK